jgi:LacI family transcriptional regulator
MVTIKDIAKLANVSIGTVDRVIHSRGRFSAETQAKILKIIKETGYKTNVLASQLVRSKVHNFGVIMPYPYQNDKYWQISINGMQNATQSLSHFKINLEFYYYDRYLNNSFINSYKKAVDDKNDGLLIAPVLSHLAEKYLRDYSSDIPFLLFNADIPGLDNKLSFIGQDSFRGGRTAGKLMSILIQNKGKLAVVETTPPDYHINVRASGFEDFFKSYKDVEIFKYYLPDHEEFKAFDQLTQQMFDENSDLKGIFVPNVSTHYFAESVKKMNFGRKINIIGYDLINENINCLKEGIIDFIINQQPLRQGYESVLALYRKVVLKTDIEKERLLPIEIVSIENLDSFIVNYNKLI